MRSAEGVQSPIVDVIVEIANNRDRRQLFALWNKRNVYGSVYAKQWEPSQVNLEDGFLQCFEPVWLVLQRGWITFLRGVNFAYD